MAGSTNSYRTELSIMASIQSVSAQLNYFAVDIPLLVGQVLGSFGTLGHNLKKEDMEWREQIARFLVGSLSLAQLGLSSYYFFTGHHCKEEASLAICKAALYLSYVRSGVVAALSVGSGLYRRPLQTENNGVNQRQTGSSDSYRTELSIIASAHDLSTSFNNFAVDIPLLAVQVFGSLGTFGHNLGKAGAELREQMARLLVGAISIGQIALISYYFFAGIHCKDTPTLTVCLVALFLNYLKSGLLTALSVGSGLYQRSQQMEMNISHIRSLAPRRFFHFVPPVAPPVTTMADESMILFPPVVNPTQDPAVHTAQAPVFWSMIP